MRTKDFIALCVRRHVTLSSYRIVHAVRGGTLMMRGLQWWDYRRLAKMTELLDYGCEFTELGCHNHRMSKWEKEKALERLDKSEDGKYFSSRLMCCCQGCRGTVGWNRNLPNDYHRLKRIASCFNEETGFWRVNKGCVLPREYRSTTCLRHSCKDIRPAISGAKLRKYLGMSDSQIQNEYYKRTKKRPGSASFICDKLREEMEEEIRNANSANSDGA